MFPIADGHCDFLYGMLHYGYHFDKPVRKQTIALDHLKKGNVKLQLFACWMDTTLKTPAVQQCVELVDAYNRLLDENEALVAFDRSFDPDGDKIATVLTIEGGEAIEGSKAVLRVFKKLGVRAMSFTWNEANELSGAAMARQGKGLTTLGKEIVDEMTRLHMAIDVSHVSDAAIDDILSRTDMPIFATHSNARGIFDSPRNLKDEHIAEIARRGGTIGVNFYHRQLSSQKRACIDDIVRHMMHLLEVGGINVCAIGSDFDGMQVYPRDLADPGDFPALMNALKRQGLSDDELYRIAYANLADYIVQFV